MPTILLFAFSAVSVAQGGAVAGVSPPPGPPPPGLRIVSKPDATRLYPVRERKAKRGGVVDVDLGLRRDGKVTRCRVEVSSGSAALDAAACELGRALRFEAAPNLVGSGATRWGRLEYGCCTRVRVEWRDGGARVRAISAPRSLRVLNPAEIMTAADYPAQAVASKAAGLVAIELSASPAGAVTQCRVVQSSGSPLLDETSCTLATSRARLLPATNEYAEPVAGSTRIRLRWKIGD
jgi:TonB family protein